MFRAVTLCFDFPDSPTREAAEALPMDAESIIRTLGLRPHPEGGFFAETYRSEDILPASSLPGRVHPTGHGHGHLLLAHSRHLSTLHRLGTGQIFHFYAGDAVEMLKLFPDGSHRIITIGSDLASSQIPRWWYRGEFGKAAG